MGKQFTIKIKVMWQPKIIQRLLSKKTKEKIVEFYLALESAEASVKAAIWEYSRSEQKVTLKFVCQEETVEKIAERIKSETDFPLRKLVLGLPPSAISGEKIKKEEILKISKAVKKLSLTPVGFVIIPDAIAHFLKKKEETPQSAIFIYFGKRTIAFSLFRGGKSKKNVQIERSEMLFSDFEEGLSHFSGEEVLPSKIILYDGQEKLEEIREELLSYPWQKNSKFLHVPKIEILPWDFSIKAVVEAGTFELINSELDLEEETGETVKNTEAFFEEEKALEEKFGFVQDEDIVKKEEPVTILKERIEESESLIEKQEEQAKERLMGEKRKLDFKLPPINLPAKLSSLLKKTRISGPNKIIPLVVLLLVLGGVFISSFYFYPYAKINLIAASKTLKKNIDISLNTSISSINIDNEEIPGRVYTAEVSGEKTIETTGKKTIGEKAKGEVTIYNKTAGSKTFLKGTTIVGSSDLLFSLDSEVTIASASDTGVSLEYGKTKVGVTATKIGPTGNVKKETDFKIDDFASSSFVARNEADFSGGTEREIDVVSKEDREDLYSELLGQLKEQAKEELTKQIGNDEKFLEESIKENIDEKVFDKEVSDESDNLSLKLKIEFSALGYKEEDLNGFLKQYIVQQVPPDYEYDKEKSYFNVNKAEYQDDGSVLFNADYYAYLLPQIDTSSFKKIIVGKSIRELEEEVRKLTDKGILGYEIANVRRFPVFKNKLPLLGKNIEISIVSY